MLKQTLRATATATITGTSHDGRGIAHINGKTIFIEGALIGEEVEFEYIKKRSRFDEGKLTQLILASPDRVIPECDFFGICGGCSLQHMNASQQITLKQNILLEQLQHMGGVVPKEIMPPILSSRLGYRRKARLGVKYVFKKEKMLIGFREKNGRYLADIESCAVLHPSVGQKIPLLRSFIMELESYLHIPQIEVAVGENATALIIRHLVPLTTSDLSKIAEFAKYHNFHIYLQSGGPDTAALFYPNNIQPRLSYQLQDYGIELLFHPTDFAQVNSEVNQKLIHLAIELLAPQPTEIILDLFCGIGNFTLPLSRFCKHVIGVEGCELMVERGYENAAHNAIMNVEFICKNLADNNYNDRWVDSEFQRILLDPPRTGAWEIVQRIPQWNAARVVYVSCNPATLARDSGYLCSHGYELLKVGVLDMFPHTSHVEAIALFAKK